MYIIDADFTLHIIFVVGVFVVLPVATDIILLIADIISLATKGRHIDL